MKKLFLSLLIVICFSIQASAWNPMMVTSGSTATGEANYEMGYTATTGGTTDANLSTSTTRCSRHQATSSMTVLYGYSYCFDSAGTDDQTIVLAVYNDSEGSIGSQNGGCSDASTVITDTLHWLQYEWSSNYPSITSGNYYWICRYVNSEFEEYYVTGDSGDEYIVSDTSCPGVPTNASSRHTTFTVSNYDAH